MKSIIYSILAVLFLIIAGAVLWYVFFAPKTTSTSVTNPQGGENPLGTPAGSVPGNSTTPGVTVGTGASMILTTRDGGAISVPDFTTRNQPSTANAQNGYEVAGSPTSTFDILYFPANSGILVALYAEPLSETRLAAEGALRTTLGLSDSQLCSLVVSVRTSSDVSPYYAGKELGLSFCQGATALPK